MEKRSVTRRDIAEEAGVSVSVVSRALNNSGYVAKEKKDRILQIAERLHYMPNPVAISLQQQRTRQILFYCKNLENSFHIEMYRGMLQAASARGYMMLINGQMSFDEIRSTLVDGIIMPSKSAAAYYFQGAGKNYRLPVVSASYSDNVVLEKSVPVVEIDMFRAVEAALTYLWKLKHRRIAMITPYPQKYSNARTIAYENWVREKGLYDPDAYLIGVEQKEQGVDIPEDFFASGKQAAYCFRESRMDATAVLGFNDAFCLGFLRGCQEIGIHVPGDLSVIGMDGISDRRYVSPLLTTVSLFPQEQGAKCAQVLIDMMEGKKFRYRSTSRFQLIRGESCREYER